METKRLYKSTEDKAIFGVCGGLGEYLNLDAIVVRLLFVLFTMVYGAGILLYILAAIIMPKKPAYAYDAQYQQPVSGYTGYSGQYAPQDQAPRSFNAASAYEAPASEAFADEKPGAEAAAEQTEAPAPAADPVTEGAASAAEAVSAATAAMAQLTEQLNNQTSFETVAAEIPREGESSEAEAPETVNAEDPKPEAAAEKAVQEEPQEAQPAAELKAEEASFKSPRPAQPSQPKAESARPANDRYDQFQAYSQTAYGRKESRQSRQPDQAPRQTNKRSRKTVGLVLILLGTLLILKVLVPHIDMKLVWGGSAIIAGLFLMLAKK